MREVIFAVTALLALNILAACKTVQGLGEDIQEGGKAIERATE